MLPVASARNFCLRIFEAEDLETKLAPPPQAAGALVDDFEAFAPIRRMRPGRARGLGMRSGAPRLPGPAALGDPKARIQCLARFAHHELMAVELFAWSLLRWPDVPRGLRRDLLSILFDEQRHCRLYLARLRALGSDLGEHVLSDYFWKQAPAIAASSHGVRAFLAAMGLTLEQANLDFTLLYRDAFCRAGDEESAALCQQVHDDEIRHVRLAAHWLQTLSEPPGDLVECYRQSVPFPLSAARAKGRRFDAGARRRAGLPDAFIEYVRTARPSQELGRALGGSRPSTPQRDGDGRLP